VLELKVVILCGGLGTRLREETEFRPKPMVNIGNRPILWHIMKIYTSFGFKDFVLCLGHKSEMIKEFFYHYELMNSDVTIKLGQPREITFLQNHDENEWSITLANTGEKALKGARIKKIEKYIAEDTFMLTYGDGLADVNIAELLNFHKRHGKIATVTGINPSSRFGELKINENRVESFNEKPKGGSGFINGGFFVFNRAIFNYLSASDECDLEVGALEQLAKEGQLMVYKHTGSWACMDNIRDMDYLNKLWDEQLAFWKVW
jgi:glucose-1-phosphate cytidylyltransferase